MRRFQLSRYGAIADSRVSASSLPSADRCPRSDRSRSATAAFRPTVGTAGLGRAWNTGGRARLDARGQSLGLERATRQHRHRALGFVGRWRCSPSAGAGWGASCSSRASGSEARASPACPGPAACAGQCRRRRRSPAGRPDPRHQQHLERRQRVGRGGRRGEPTPRISRPCTSAAMKIAVASRSPSGSRRRRRSAGVVNADLRAPSSRRAIASSSGPRCRCRTAGRSRARRSGW